MEVGALFDLLKESLFFILVFFALLSYTCFRGTQALVNLILGLYLALLISLKFPYYSVILGSIEGSAKSESLLMISVFVLFTLLSTMLFSRLMITDSLEPAFTNFGRKLAFAGAATILVMVYSYHVLPVTDLITFGSPIQYLFGAPQNFFWWLLAPLVLLFLL